MSPNHNERFYPPHLVSSALTGFLNEENQVIEEGVVKRTIFYDGNISFSVVQIARGKKFQIDVKKDIEVFYITLYGSIISHFCSQKLVLNNISNYQNAHIITIEMNSEIKDEPEFSDKMKFKHEDVFSRKYLYYGLNVQVLLKMESYIIDIPPCSEFDAMEVVSGLENRNEEIMWYIPFDDSLSIITSRAICNLIERNAVRNDSEEKKRYLLFKIKGEKIRTFEW